MSITTRIRLFFITLLFVSTTAWAATPACDDTLNPDPNHQARAWERWELQVPSDNDYRQSSGNPTRDVKLKVTFTPCDGGTSFTTFGFWAGLNNPAGKDFRIRGAFPAGGTWQWELSCTSPGAPHNCTDDDGLDGKKGKFQVVEGNDTNPLYRNGFLKVVTKPKTKPPFLAFTEGETPFFWLGDTVWNAHVLMSNQNSQADWPTYLRQRAEADHADDQFTVLQLAVGPHRFFPNAPSPFGATGRSNCNGVDLLQPGPCVLMEPGFWGSSTRRFSRPTTTAWSSFWRASSSRSPGPSPTSTATR